MSATSQLTTFGDLYTDLLNRVRVSTSVSATVEQAKRYINIANHDIHLGFDYKFPWCERQLYIHTKAPYTTGTVSVNRGSSTITGSSTAWNTANSFNENNMVASGKILFAGEDVVYKIGTVSSDTSATLWRNYIGEADLSGSAYTYFEDEYSLYSGFLRLVDLQVFSPAMGIAHIPRNEFRRRFPVVKVSGRPRYACILDTLTSVTNATPVRKVLFYPYPDKVYMIPYTFVTGNLAVTSAGSVLTSMSSDTDVPIIPLRYRHAIVYHALSHWYRDKKDDGRADSANAEYEGIMGRITSDQDIATHTTAQVRPQMGSYLAAAKAPYSGGGGRRIYDLNDEFDSFRR